MFGCWNLHEESWKWGSAIIEFSVKFPALMSIGEDRELVFYCLQNVQKC